MLDYLNCIIACNKELTKKETFIISITQIEIQYLNSVSEGGCWTSIESNCRDIQFPSYYPGGDFSNFSRCGWFYTPK